MNKILIINSICGFKTCFLLPAYDLSTTLMAEAVVFPDVGAVAVASFFPEA